MKNYLSFGILFILSIPRLFAQEGRSALPAETAEELRVLQAIHDALPRDWKGWKIEDETALQGREWFHEGGEASKYPFQHEYKITYVIDLTPEEAQRRRTAFERDTRDMMVKVEELEAGTRVEVQIWVNYFEDETRSKTAPATKTVSPFNLTLWGPKAGKFFLGDWKLTKNQPTDDGVELACRAVKRTDISMGQIQALKMYIKTTPAIREEFLKKLNTQGLKALIGQSFLNQKAITVSTAKEKPLAKPLEGKNEFWYTVDGGPFTNQKVMIKHSETMEQAYLRNNHPDPNVTQNAVTRLLIQEDGDTKLRTPYPFADITVPFIRKTGEFDVLTSEEMSGKTATFSTGIGCWNGCEWSISPVRVHINVTRYDPVGGFVEGTFSGEAIAVYKANEPIEHKPNPIKIKDGYFKIRRKEDRY